MPRTAPCASGCVCAREDGRVVIVFWLKCLTKQKKETLRRETVAPSPAELLNVVKGKLWENLNWSVGV